MIFKKRLAINEVKKKDKKKLKDYAIWLLARQGYSESDLRKKLVKYAENNDDIDFVIAEMLDYGYLNDLLYAKSLLRSELSKGRGKNRVSQSFNGKGVDIDAVMNEVSSINWLELAYKAKVKKFGDIIEKEPKKKAKQIRYLQYRGYEFEIIMKVVNGYTPDEQEF